MEPVGVTLPEELLILIMIKLPVKSILRFRSVSKHWYDLLGSFEFINSHLHRNQTLISSHSYALFKKVFVCPKIEYFTEYFTLHNDNEQFHEIEDCKFPFTNFLMVGCAKGLVCIRHSDSIMLWNPYIRRALVLPDSVEPPHINNTSISSKRIKMNVVAKRMFDWCFGIGYDVVSDDIKLVRVSYFIFRLNDDPDDDSTPPLARSHYFSVFSLRSKSWKCYASCGSIHSCAHSFNVGGFVYRMGPISSRVGRLAITCFDLSDEVFTRIDTPKLGGDDPNVPLNDLDVRVINYRESLGLIHERKHMNYDIWARRGEGLAKSWMKLFSVRLGGVMEWQRLVGFTKKGVMLVAGTVGNYSISCSVEDFDRQVANYRPPKSGWIYPVRWHVETLEETLMLLNDGVDVSLLDL